MFIALNALIQGHPRYQQLERAAEEQSAGKRKWEM
jgi:hypothetical protein